MGRSQSKITSPIPETGELPPIDSTMQTEANEDMMITYNSPEKLPEVELSSQQAATLSEYFEYLHREILKSKYSDEEVTDISEAVNEMVSSAIRQEIYELDARFRPVDVLFVGSMAEGTSIGEPNEFDFLFVLQNFFAENDVELERRCGRQSGNVHIVLNENVNSELAKQWTILKGSGVRCNRFARPNISGTTDDSKSVLRSNYLHELFRQTMGKAVSNLVQKDKKIQKGTGSLSVEGQRITRNGPAVLCSFVWVSSVPSRQNVKVHISVDITPALKFNNITSVVSRKDVGNDLFYHHLIQTGYHLVIPAEHCAFCSSCFKLTFTVSELTLMQRLPEQHKQCYRILKYIMNGFQAEENYRMFVNRHLFHSYALKTFVIRHHIERRGRSCDSLGKCVMTLLSNIRHCLEVGVMWDTYIKLDLPSISLESQNLFDKPVEESLYISYDIALKEVTEYLRKVSNLGKEESHILIQMGQVDFPIVRKTIG